MWKRKTSIASIANPSIANLFENDNLTQMPQNILVTQKNSGDHIWSCIEQ